MDKKILEQIADKYGVDTEEILKEMELALSKAAEKSAPLWVEMFGTEHVPACAEFCNKVAERI